MGEPIRSDSITWGENAEHPTYSDHHYVRCGHCGFVCNTDRDVVDRDGSRAGDGYSRYYTQLSVAVAIGDTTINVDSTTGFPTTGTAYIHATNGSGMMPFAYTGVSSTTFTGVTGVVKAFAIDDYVRYDTISTGCPMCGSLRYKEI
jgi:hypothetical protein